MFQLHKPVAMPGRDQALPGRDTPMRLSGIHHVSQRSLLPPWPGELHNVLFGMGCFWGAERLFWQERGVWVTSVGYAGGHTPNPTYEEVCSGMTGHAEVVQVVFDPREVDFSRLLQLFWESHDPTQGMRQGNDIGTQYRSVIYCESPQLEAEARASGARFASALSRHGRGEVTTEIAGPCPYYLAEEAHQQYLAKNPAGYCGLRGTGICLPD